MYQYHLDLVIIVAYYSFILSLILIILNFTFSCLVINYFKKIKY